MGKQTAPADGVYTINGHRFRVRAGGRIPDGAEFSTEGEAAKESAKDQPKWFQELVAKAAETGAMVPPREGNEGEKAYKERVAQHGPAENTEGQGPQETS